MIARMRPQPKPPSTFSAAQAYVQRTPPQPAWAISSFLQCVSSHQLRASRTILQCVGGLASVAAPWLQVRTDSLALRLFTCVTFVIHQPTSTDAYLLIIREPIPENFVDERGLDPDLREESLFEGHCPRRSRPIGTQRGAGIVSGSERTLP